MSDLADVIAALAAGRPRNAEAALAMMRLSLMDWAACAMAGASEPAARAVRATVLAEAGSAQATLVGGGRVPARAAALANGTAGHALDYDDTHFAHIGHPSAAVVPAALAAAEMAGADATALLQAALVGCEASIRVGLWLGRAHYQTGFHQTATAGAFGATLAPARLLGLDAGQTATALRLVATRASGLKSQFGAMGKPLNAGIAASNGVEAALLAAKGFVAMSGALEGPQGFGPTHAGEGNADAFDRFGETWLFQTVSHKFHACCHGTHAVLEALASLGPGLDEVATITIHTNPRWLGVCNIARPATGLEAKFSYRMTAAMALAGRDTGNAATFSDAACADPVLTGLCDRVRVVPDEGLAETAARVTLVSTDGAVREAFHDLASPPPPETLAARLRVKAAGLLGETRAAHLSEAVAAPDLGALLAMLSRRTV